MNKITVSKKTLFFSALLLLPALFFQRKIICLFLYILTLICLVKIKGKRIRLISNFFLLLGLVVFSLLSPQGKILFTIGKFSITLGALEIGLRKGFILLGMVYCSQLAISKELVLPGKIGKFIATVFAYFEEITAKAFRYNKEIGIIASIDNHILDAYEKNQNASSQNCNQQNSTASQTNVLGFVLILFLYCFFYIPLFL